LAKFNLSTDKQLFVRGGLVSLKAGEVDTDDKDLIKALEGAIGVEPLAPVKQKLKGGQAE
jgi:hypothetical protein